MVSEASSFPLRVSVEGETLKLMYVTGRLREGGRRKNTFICVKEKMKQKAVKPFPAKEADRS